MNHKKLREEKNCLNCGHIVEERFCTHCGQENLQIQDSAFHLIIHYIQDLFHYDGKFWHTLKNLLVKPGLVALEYMEGRRTRNLEPVRFYVFASTVFFLILFYLVNAENWNVSVGLDENNSQNLNNPGLHTSIDTLHHVEEDTTINGLELDLSTPITADSMNEGWLDKLLTKRAEEKRKELEEKHEGDETGALKEFINELFHKTPQLLFLSLPFFAFFLKLLYIRSSRRNYVDHFIFSVYHYAYLFIIMSFFLVINYVVNESGKESLQNIFDYLTGGLVVYIFIYLLLAMKRFYNDRWVFLILRYLVLLVCYTMSVLVLFLLFIFMTALL